MDLALTTFPHWHIQAFPSHCAWYFWIFEILVGNVWDLPAMQARRIAEQEIAFAVQAVGAVLANDHEISHTATQAFPMPRRNVTGNTLFPASPCLTF